MNQNQLGLPISVRGNCTNVGSWLTDVRDDEPTNIRSRKPGFDQAQIRSGKPGSASVRASFSSKWFRFRQVPVGPIPFFRPAQHANDFIGRTRIEAGTVPHLDICNRGGPCRELEAKRFEASGNPSAMPMAAEGFAVGEGLEAPSRCQWPGPSHIPDASGLGGHCRTIKMSSFGKKC